MPTPLKAFTLAPFGMEEGTATNFPIANSPDRRRAGAVPLLPIRHAQGRSAGSMIDEVGPDWKSWRRWKFASREGGQAVPVTLEALVTETGVLEVWCVARDGRR